MLENEQIDGAIIGEPENPTFQTKRALLTESPVYFNGAEGDSPFMLFASGSQHSGPDNFLNQRAHRGRKFSFKSPNSNLAKTKRPPFRAAFLFLKKNGARRGT